MARTSNWRVLSSTLVLVLVLLSSLATLMLATGTARAASSNVDFQVNAETRDGNGGLWGLSYDYSPTMAVSDGTIQAGASDVADASLQASLSSISLSIPAENFSGRIFNGTTVQLPTEVDPLGDHSYSIYTIPVVDVSVILHLTVLVGGSIAVSGAGSGTQGGVSWDASGTQTVPITASSSANPGDTVMVQLAGVVLTMTASITISSLTLPIPFPTYSTSGYCRSGGSSGCTIQGTYTVFVPSSVTWGGITMPVWLLYLLLAIFFIFAVVGLATALRTRAMLNRLTSGVSSATGTIGSKLEPEFGSLEELLSYNRVTDLVAITGGLLCFVGGGVWMFVSGLLDYSQDTKIRQGIPTVAFEDRLGRKWVTFGTFLVGGLTALPFIYILSAAGVNYLWGSIVILAAFYFIAIPLSIVVYLRDRKVRRNAPFFFPSRNLPEMNTAYSPSTQAPPITRHPSYIRQSSVPGSMWGGGQFAVPPSSQQATPPNVYPGGACPRCGSETTYLPEAQGWYCSNCSQLVG